MKKILFTDFDGCLRPFSYTEACEKLWKANPFCKTKDEYGYYFAPYSIDALRYICAVTGCYLVFSTDWRKNGLSALKELWNQRGYPFYDRIIGITPITHTGHRGMEIEAWIRENPKYTKAEFSYAILDDLDDMGPMHEGRHIAPDKRYGLTMNEAGAIIEVLKKEYVKPPKDLYA